MVLEGTTSGTIQLQLNRISKPVGMEHWCPRLPSDGRKILPYPSTSPTDWDIAATGLLVLGSTHTSGCPQGPNGSISISSPLYQEVQGQTHLELTHSNRIHSKYNQPRAGDSCWYLYYIFWTQECLIQSSTELLTVMPSVCIQLLEQLYSSLMLLKTHVLSPG